MPLVEEGDIIETIKTIYPSLNSSKEKRNVILEGVEMTMPLASSRETKILLKKENSKLLKVFKDVDRGDILIVKEINPNKIVVENCSLKEEYKKDFEIEKLDIIKGNFNVVKRRSIDLIKTLNKLIGDS
jgi:hypothetical protein